MMMARIPAASRLAVARLLRTRRARLAIVGWAIFATATAILERATGATSGADHLMTGLFGRVVLPLQTFAIVSAVVGGSGLKPGVAGLVALGAKRERAVLGTTAVALLASALLASALALAVVALAHGATDPPLLSDLVATAWIAALGGAAYGAYFSAAAALGRTGAARAVFLVFDFLVAGLAGVLAVLTPRGHLLSLFGGPPCAELSQRASSGALVLLAVGYVVVTLAFARRP